MRLEECSNLDTSQPAFQISNSISNSVFIIALHVIKKFFSLTLPLSIILQKVDVNLLYYYKRMAEVCRIFEEIEELKNIFFYSEVLRNERINEVPRTIYRQKIQDNIPTYFLENIIKDISE
ncbi:52 kDa repressor of the inhibitor of the protein kinase-like [Aphis craccivora]|uniref:52 kDa repressor of the inhibitor of the protein kinase-like n=1 Tax=Aphis craccivora TaxID=307492 RepID=A0A6G0Z4W0_APHCR|nr:52 kDa repressor of the inhibitor of the protein kinase-like [Aphis craccivora]